VGVKGGGILPGGLMRKKKNRKFAPMGQMKRSKTGVKTRDKSLSTGKKRGDQNPSKKSWKVANERWGPDIAVALRPKPQKGGQGNSGKKKALRKEKRAKGGTDSTVEMYWFLGEDQESL